MSWFVNTLKSIGVTDIPRVFVETGTYLGDGIERERHSFHHVHSIELLEKHALAAANRFKDISNVTVHHGDSAVVLEQLALSITESAIFYLDAHYSGGETAFGKEEDKGCPVLRELKVLGQRPYNDIVVIDDMRLMGQAKFSGTPGDSIYPWTFFDFSHATKDNILAAYSKPCKQHICSDFDRLVLYHYTRANEFCNT